MGTPLSNKVVTRGFGSPRPVTNRSGPITQGYGGPPTFVAETFRRASLRLGQSGTKRRLQELDEVIVWARLVTVNDVEPKRPVKGWIRARVDRGRGYASAMAEHVGSRVRSVLEAVRISVTRERGDRG